MLLSSFRRIRRGRTRRQLFRKQYFGCLPFFSKPVQLVGYMRQRGRQFLIAAVAVALWCVCCVAVLPGLAERVGRSLNIGYAVGCDSRHCAVTGVDPRGPAAGMLQRGDAILDIDGVSGFSLDRPTRLVSSAT